MSRTKALEAVMNRAAAWPADAQEELALIAQEIEAELAAGVYRASAAELAGIDRGLSDAAKGNFVSEAELEATFAKHRRK